jgi:hypothetical protein
VYFEPLGTAGTVLYLKTSFLNATMGMTTGFVSTE